MKQHTASWYFTTHGYPLCGIARSETRSRLTGRQTTFSRNNSTVLLIVAIAACEAMVESCTDFVPVEGMPNVCEKE